MGDVIWRCEECGEAHNPIDPRWRWTGEQWEHHHGYPAGHVAARPFPPVDPCLWTEDEDGNWHTACGEVFCFISEHGPVESSMRWCCYCGKPLSEKRYEEAGDA